MSGERDGGAAFPHTFDTNLSGYFEGMLLRDWFAGQALGNPAICTGTAPEYDLAKWFGGRGGITKQEIAAKQARIYADAMLAERSKP